MSSKAQGEKFLAFYENEVDALFRFVFFRVNDDELAKDIIQETFLKMWKTLSSSREIENERAFLFRIARNLVIDHYRKTKEYSLDNLIEEGFDVSDDNVLPIEIAIDRDIALELLQSLPEKYCDVVWLRMVEEWSVKDIAEFSCETENVVSVRIHRGLKLWREVVREHSGKKMPSQSL